MKINKNIPFIIISLFLSISINSYGYDFKVGRIYYNIVSSTNKTVEVTHNIGGSIGDLTYYGKIVIPSTVSYSGVTYSVKYIGSWAFEYCSELTEVTIPNSVSDIGHAAFSGCNSLTSVNIPNSVTSIGKWAFTGCSGLTSVNIPNSVTSIGEEAFYCCSGLTSVTIPNSVTSINGAPFAGCSGLTSIKVESGNSKYDSRDNCNAIIKTETNTLIAGCQNTVIPGSVTSIDDRAFFGCSGLTSVTIPNSVTSIGDEAFEGTGWYNNQSNGILYLENYCLGYKGDKPIGELSLKEGTRLICDSAFKGCSGLTSVTIPNSVTSIGGSAFSGCSGLTSVTIGNSVTSIGDKAFEGTGWYNNQSNGILYLENYCLGYKGDKPIGELSLKEGTRLIGYRAFYDCSGLTSITIPNSVTSIGDYAFYNCRGLTSVTIPNSVTSIGHYAFRGCSGLTSVTIGNSVTSIGNEAFYYCSGLTSVTIPNSVTSIGYSAFSQCSGLTSVTIGNSVTNIGFYAFQGCSKLTSITIPNSVTSIEKYAFSGCSGLTEVNITDLSAWCKIDFGGYNSNPLVYARYLKLNGSEITELVIPDEITAIKRYAFYCSGLKSVTIGNSVTSIGDYAFYGCTGLTSVTIGNSVTSIGNEAFKYCIGLTKLYSKAIVPPTCDVNAFYEIDKENCVLYVPSASIVRYKAASQWKDFYNIKDIESGVEEVFVDGEDYSNAPIEIFNLSGLKVGDSTENLAPGVYIKRQGRKVEKIAIQ